MPSENAHAGLIFQHSIKIKYQYFPKRKILILTKDKIIDLDNKIAKNKL
ncbi:hypothetical protein LVJ85_01575 [Neisseria sp. Dent CA1/247]|nr:hypothetical protein [Neisseria sp. Dent CA1/247]UOO77216.1 hypothetical protein LVJ85_01575 [Neisseria sp. Dent CA1/247]